MRKEQFTFSYAGDRENPQPTYTLPMDCKLLLDDWTQREPWRHLLYVGEMEDLRYAESQIIAGHRSIVLYLQAIECAMQQSEGAPKATPLFYLLGWLNGNIKKRMYFLAALRDVCILREVVERQFDPRHEEAVSELDRHLGAVADMKEECKQLERGKPCSIEREKVRAAIKYVMGLNAEVELDFDHKRHHRSLSFPTPHNE